MREIKAELGGSAELQNDLAETWHHLEDLPRFPEQDLPKKKAGDVLGVKDLHNDHEAYKVFEIDAVPKEYTGYPAKPWLLIQRAGKTLENSPLVFWVEKWPNGIRIDAEPMTPESDRTAFYHKGGAEYMDVPSNVTNELTRLTALALMKKAKLQDPTETERASRIIGKIKKTMGEV